MRRSRFLVPAGMEGVYHVVSRVVDRRMVFGDEEKRHFVKLMKGYAGFCGVSLVSWCVMSNHFHILVAVPEKTGEEVPEAVVLKRMGMIYGAREMKEFRKMLDACGTADGRRSMLLPYTRRMGDLGLFMKTLKQRFTQWFNRKHQRKGTLWEDRYRSTIVEYQGYSKPVTGTDREAAEVKSHAARVVAAYIDLNPVRAGILEDPKDYEWSSYGAAVRGDKDAVRGLQALWGEGKAKCLAEHRLFIFEEGEEELTQEGKTQDTRAGDERHVRCGIDAKKVWAERERGGRLPLGVMLRLRVRYLTDGAIVGSKEFVERVTGGRGGAKPGVPMRFGQWGGLHALRNLRVSPVGG